MRLLFFLFFLPSLAFGQLRLNEMQSSNTATVADNLGNYEDWIELYNADTTFIDISGYVLRDAVDTWMIPYTGAAGILGPGQTFLIWCDNDTVAGNFRANFKLSAANGEFVGLYAPDSVTLLDSITIPPLQDDESYRYCPQDGWQITTTPTPLASNNCAVGIATNDAPAYRWLTLGEGHYAIQFATPLDQTVVLSVIDNTGAQILEKRISDSYVEIDGSKWAEGIYFVSLQSAHWQTSLKLIRP